MTKNLAGQRASGVVRIFRPVPDARLRLVCCPHAGASATAHAALARALPEDIEALVAEYRGRRKDGDREGFTGIEDLADLVSAALAPRVDRPVAIYGHSMGSVVAFEVTRRLEADGIEVARLFVSGRRAPSAGLGGNLPSTDEEIVAELTTLGGVPRKLLDKPRFRKAILAVIRHDYRANSGYLAPPDRLVRAPVTFLLSDADSYVDRAAADGWREHTTGDFHVVRFRGGHFFLNEQLSQVVDTIATELPQPSNAGPRPERRGRT